MGLLTHFSFFPGFRGLIIFSGMNKRRNDSLVKVAMTAILMTLSILMSRFLSTYLVIGGTPLVEIGFQTLPVMVCSLVCGPFYGAICGGGSDLVTALAFPVGPFFPGFTIDSALLGLIPGLVMRLAKGKEKKSLLLGIGILLLSSLGLSFSLPFVENLKIGDFRLELSLGYRLGIPLAYALFAFLLLLVCFFVDKKLARRKRKNAFTLLDCFLSYYSRDLFLRPFLAPVWLLLLYHIPYEVSFLSQLLGSFLVLPIEAILFHVLLYPVSIVCRPEIEKTYATGEKTYSKLYKGKDLSNPFLFL